MDRAQSSTQKGSFDRTVIDVVIRLAFIGLLAFWSLKLIAPFITVVIWGVVLAVALYPVFAWLRDKLGGRGTIAAALITLVFLAIVIGPASVLGTLLIENLQDFSEKVADGKLEVPPPPEGVKGWPLVGENLYEFWALANTNMDAALARIGPQLKATGSAFLSAAAGTGLGILQFAASVIIAGFLFTPAEKLGRGMKAFATRIVATRGEEFVDLAGATIRNVARGVIGISILQTLLIGMGLMVAGVPFAGIITFACLILAIVQVGPGILVIGAIIWAWSDMGTVGALIFTVYMVPVMLLDNFLKPIVMSAGLSTPMLVIFIGVIGGTLAHGIIGLFLGPIVLAVAYELLVAWVRDGRSADERPSAPSN